MKNIENYIEKYYYKAGVCIVLVWVITGLILFI